MVTETLTPQFTHPPIHVYHKPYFKVEVFSKDHNNLIIDDVFNFTQSVPCNEQISERVRWVGLWNYNSNSTADLTKTFTFPSDGYYQIEVESYCHPRHTGSFQLYDGSTAIEEAKSCQESWSFKRNVIYKPRHYSSGSHTLKFSITTMAWLGRFIITPLIKYEADNEGTAYKRSRSIPFSTLEWTENSVNEQNALTLQTRLSPDYWRDYEWYNPLQFDLTDIITLYGGEKRRTSQPLFGGYITGYSIDNEGGLELRAIDRLWDLDRTPIYQNFSIGGASAPAGSTRPFTDFPSVYELSRFLGTTGRHSINTYNVPYEYGLYIDFSNSTDYNRVSTTGGYTKYWDTKLGPSLRVNIANTTGTSTAVLFDDQNNPYDAYDYGMFGFNYYASGASSRYPLEFNLHLNMHREGESVSSATDYTIYFTDTAISESNVIGSVNPTFTGAWNRFNINLKDWFDRHCPSTEYNISKVWIEGTVTDEMLHRRKCSSIYLTRIIGYKEINHAPKYASQDVKTRYEELKQLCERTEHVAYVEYADNRQDDVLVVLPEKYTTCAGTVDEKNNLISLDNLEYNPLEDDFCNSKHITFNFDENNSGSSTNTDYTSTAHYGYIADHEFNSDINNQVDADKEVNTTVTSNSFKKPAFGVTVQGYPEIQPLQYVTCNLPTWRITGDHQVKSITRNYSDGKLTTTLDLNQPSQRFRNILLQVRRDLENQNTRDSRGIYTTGGARFIGLASSGAFSE